MVKNNIENDLKIGSENFIYIVNRALIVDLRATSSGQILMM